jgi:glycosyltransferase involved in cell wall biosynthesis
MDNLIKLSVILPVHDEYTYTRWCLLSLINRSSVPTEIIIVNDRSGKETTDFLKKFSNDYGCIYLETERQSWHSLSCNIGLDHVKGEYVCLLNSDTIVTNGWDIHQLEFLDKNPMISCVGPSTSYCASHQQLPQYHNSRYTIKYYEAEELGKAVYEKYCGQSMITRITGFCMTFHRRMLDIIGRLNHVDFPSAGNEMDWMLRGMQKCYNPAWVKYAYVHHYGQASYVKAIGQEEKQIAWKRADDRLKAKYGEHLYNTIQRTFWLDQKVEY